LECRADLLRERSGVDRLFLDCHFLYRPLTHRRFLYRPFLGRRSGAFSRAQRQSDRGDVGPDRTIELLPGRLDGAPELLLGHRRRLRRRSVPIAPADQGPRQPAGDERRGQKAKDDELLFGHQTGLLGASQSNDPKRLTAVSQAARGVWPGRIFRT
jgi:hypothetical protein